MVQIKTIDGIYIIVDQGMSENCVQNMAMSHNCVPDDDVLNYLTITDSRFYFALSMMNLSVSLGIHSESGMVPL